MHEDVGLVMLVPEKAADSEPGPTFATRVLELEVEKWEVEQDREAAKMEAEEAKRELDRAQARVSNCCRSHSGRMSRISVELTAWRTSLCPCSSRCGLLFFLDGIWSRMMTLNHENVD